MKKKLIAFTLAASISSFASAGPITLMWGQPPGSDGVTMPESWDFRFTTDDPGNFPTDVQQIAFTDATRTANSNEFSYTFADPGYALGTQFTIHGRACIGSECTDWSTDSATAFVEKQSLDIIGAPQSITIKLKF